MQIKNPIMGHKAGPVHGDLRAQIVSTTWTLGVAFLYFFDIKQKFQSRIDLRYEIDGSVITFLRTCIRNVE